MTTEDLSLQLESNKINRNTTASLINLTKLSLKHKAAIKPLTQSQKLKPSANLPTVVNYSNTKGATKEGFDLAQILYDESAVDLDPDPLNNALGFMRDSLGVETQNGINLITLKDLKTLKAHPIIYMTGIESFQLSKLEKKNLKSYLNSGGFLFADAKCSCDDFHQSFIRLINEISPEQKLTPILLNSLVHNQPFKKDIKFSKTLQKKQSPEKPFLLGLKGPHRYRIIYSPIDISSSLKHKIDNDTPAVHSKSALKLIVNIISYGLTF